MSECPLVVTGGRAWQAHVGLQPSQPIRNGLQKQKEKRQRDKEKTHTHIHILVAMASNLEAMASNLIATFQEMVEKKVVAFGGASSSVHEGHLRALHQLQLLGFNRRWGFFRPKQHDLAKERVSCTQPNKKEPTSPVTTIVPCLRPPAKTDYREGGVGKTKEHGLVT